tara:strand:+ start:4350 stop:5042 length:693 start_codon:yes stop_codon:yes gene_type:complete
MKNLNCLVTGASSGIGKQISIELSKFAKRIYIISRNVQKLEETHDQVVRNNCECIIVPLDLTNENGIENLAKEIFERDKFLDMLVLSAGIISHLSPVDSIILEKFKEILNLNYTSNFRMIKSFHPLLKNSKNGKIALISSIMDTSKEYYWGTYQPTMTGLNELFLTYAKENKNTKIMANIFCPKAVNTELRDTAMPGEDKSKISSSREVARIIVNHLLNSTNTGKIINID